MRVFARRERPHPGAQLSLFEAAGGWRYCLWVTNLPAATRGWRGQCAYIDAAHRVHARVQDVIRTGKNTGPGHFPSHDYGLNKAWLDAAMTACILLSSAPAPKAPYWKVNKHLAALVGVIILALAGLAIALVYTIGPGSGAGLDPVIGTWSGKDANGWSGTLTINSDHTLQFHGTINGVAISNFGYWTELENGKQLIVVEPYNNRGAIFYYNLSDAGKTLIYTESGVSDITRLSRTISSQPTPVQVLLPSPSG